MASFLMVILVVLVNNAVGTRLPVALGTIVTRFWTFGAACALPAFCLPSDDVLSLLIYFPLFVVAAFF